MLDPPLPEILGKNVACLIVARNLRLYRESARSKGVNAGASQRAICAKRLDIWVLYMGLNNTKPYRAANAQDPGLHFIILGTSRPWRPEYSYALIASAIILAAVED